MKDNVALRLVMRSLVNIILSAILAVVSVLTLLFLGYQLPRGQFRSLLLEIVRYFNVNLVMFVIGAVLFFIYFCVLQWILFNYYSRVNLTVRLIADGQLDMNHQIEVRPRNPFGVIASNVNRLSDRLRQALEEERKAEQTKNELITNVSHDLRTPLTSVIGYLGLIEQDRYRDEVELRHYVQIAYEKSQRLHVLIDDLFEYTRMRYDTIALKEETFNLIEMLGQLLVQYHLPLQEAGMKSRLISSETTVMVKADAAKLVRVFENLIANAMSYGKEGKRIDLHVLCENKSVIIEVINYGEPIPAIDLPHIFDRFYRVDKARTQWIKGSGLGLAISKSIVEKHGGRIEAFSDSEQTMFRVSLPLH